MRIIEPDSGATSRQVLAFPKSFLTVCAEFDRLAPDHLKATMRRMMEREIDFVLEFGACADVCTDDVS